MDGRCGGEGGAWGLCSCGLSVGERQDVSQLGRSWARARDSGQDDRGVWAEDGFVLKSRDSVARSGCRRGFVWSCGKCVYAACMNGEKGG